MRENASIHPPPALVLRMTLPGQIATQAVQRNVRAQACLLGVMGNTVKFPFLAAGGLNTDIVFGVCPIDADECGELKAGQCIHTEPPKC